jgi:hypothetical protein
LTKNARFIMRTVKSLRKIWHASAEYMIPRFAWCEANYSHYMMGTSIE